MDTQTPVERAVFLRRAWLETPRDAAESLLAHALYQLVWERLTAYERACVALGPDAPTLILPRPTTPPRLRP